MFPGPLRIAHGGAGLQLQQHGVRRAGQELQAGIQRRLRFFSALQIQERIPLLQVDVRAQGVVQKFVHFQTLIGIVQRGLKVAFGKRKRHQRITGVDLLFRGQGLRRGVDVQSTAKQRQQTQGKAFQRPHGQTSSSVLFPGGKRLVQRLSRLLVLPHSQQRQAKVIPAPVSYTHLDVYKRQALTSRLERKPLPETVTAKDTLPSVPAESM